MSARLRIVGVAALALAVTVAALVLLFRSSTPPPEPLPAQADGMAVRASLSPRAYTFGEQLFARVELLLDRGAFDPEQITLDARFAPFEVRGEPRVDRRDFDDLTRLRYVYELECLAKECVPESIEKPIQFAPLVVEHDGTPVDDLTWPRTSIVARVRQSSITEVPGSDWRATAVVAAPSYRLPPLLLVALPAVAAVALYGLAAVLVVVGSAGLMARWRRLRQTPLERALVGVERASAAGVEADQRLALDRLADELRARGAGDLSVVARRLAWGEGSLGSERTAPLSRDVRELLHGRSNGRR